MAFGGARTDGIRAGFRGSVPHYEGNRIELFRRAAQSAGGHTLYQFSTVGRSGNLAT